MLKNDRKSVIGLAVFVSLLLLAAGIVYAQTPTPAAFTSKIFMWDGGDLMVVSSGGEVEFQAGSVLDVKSGAIFAPATVAVTQDSTITASSTVVQLTAADSVGTSSISTSAAGQLLIILGPASNTVTISDTGTLKLSGNHALSANDTLTLLGDGTNWNELSFVNN